MGSALLNTTLLDPAFHEPHPALAGLAAEQSLHSGHRSDLHPETPDALRLHAAQRLAAHRDRRGRLRSQLTPHRSSTPESADVAPSAARAARIADAVARRYAQSPSYRAYLAAEAERAIQEARAAAEIAELNAQAVARAQEELLISLEASLAESSFDSYSEDCDPEFRFETEALPQLHPSQSTNVLSYDLEPGLAKEALTVTEVSPEQPARHAEPEVGEVLAPSLFAELGTQGKTRRSALSAGARALRSNRVKLPAASAPEPAAGLTVRLLDDCAPGIAPLASLAPTLRAATPASIRIAVELQSEEETRALDEEIAFRRAPIFEEAAGPPIPLPANLIEFPRHLVAPRKARPRCAEGPLREEDPLPPAGSQLRIFEVDPAQISTSPETAATPTPQWTSIWLDAPQPAATEAPVQPASNPSVRPWDAGHLRLSAEAALPACPRPQTATVPRRLLAAGIDGCIVFLGFVFFAAAFAALAGRTALSPVFAIAAGALSIAILYLLYQVLFFSFSEATPGMRFARIALCTFDDNNPTRTAMRRRVFAVMLSTCSLGLGFLWAAFDKDRLAWHDIISRMYQRSY